MAMSMTERQLKQALLKEYGCFSDRRIKNIDRRARFIVDDRCAGDYGADRNLFGWFCSIFAEVIGSQTVKVTLCGGVPISNSVTVWQQQYDVEAIDHQIAFTVNPDDLPKLSELAQAFEAIVAHGAPRYPVNAYKYVCPRTAAALERLRECLSKHWGA
jgi:hypothetical protein